MTIYFVLIRYNAKGVYYRILPYNLFNTIRVHFKFYNGWKSLIPFLRLCRLTRKGATKLIDKMKKDISLK